MSQPDDLDRINERLRTIESNLRRALQALNLEWKEPTPTEGVPDEVVELLRAGNKIEAVKRYRDITGSSMGEAKAIVDAITV